MERNKTNECYSCEHRRTIPGDAHLECVEPDTEMKGIVYGIMNGWFKYPFNYDPGWKEKDCKNYKGERIKENEMGYKLGDILEVKSLDGEIHYEKVTKLLPELLTEDMCENEIEDMSIKGLSENYVYRILANYEIVKALNKTYL